MLRVHAATLTSNVVELPGLAFSLLAENVPAPEGSGWIALVIAVVLVVGIGVASCMDPKRGHRD